MFKLEILDLYFRRNRQVGHTIAMLNGAKSDKNIFVIMASNMQKSYIDLPEEQYISMRSLDRLKGKTNPILIDHFTVQLMYEEMKNALEKKDKTISKLTHKIEILENR